MRAQWRERRRSRYGLRARGGPVLALTLLSSAASAQTLPVPSLPPTGDQSTMDDAGAAILDTAVATRRPPRGWEYALGVGGGWDSNIDVLVPDGPSSYAVVPKGGLARVISGSRGELRLTGAGRWTGYPDEPERSRYYGDLALDGTYRSSASTIWTTSGSYSLGYSDASRVLWDQGVLLPLARTRSAVAALGVTHRVGRGSLRVDGIYRRTEFDAGTLVDGNSARGTLAAERPLGQRGTLGLSYSLEDVLADNVAGRSYLTHFGSLQWSRVFSHGRAGLLLEAGGSYTPDAARAALERRQSFFGGLSLSRQVKRSNVIVFVRREVTPAFGLGVSRFELRAGVTSIVPLGRAWELRLDGSHVQPETPAGTAQPYPSSDEWYASLGRRLGGAVEISAETRYRRRGLAGSVLPVEAFQAILNLTLLSPGGWPIVATAGR